MGKAMKRQKKGEARGSSEDQAALVKAICFYLPQFHPVPENDEWWGEGFTEWRNVAKARPNFEGHYQPHVPADLGFYDLRLVENQRKQADLARRYGIHGFCYHYYWFNGRRILERPFNQILENPQIDFPFCVCWANENWTRTWDGGANQILLQQNHNSKDDEAFLRALLPAFRDRRYIKVEGRPLLIVYRTSLFPDPAATAARWRSIAMAEGFPDLHLCAVQYEGMPDPREVGFDAAIEFPPHNYILEDNLSNPQPVITSHCFNGGILDYQKMVVQALQRPLPEYRLYRGVVPSWDNTARRQDNPHLFVNSTPLEYRIWLHEVAEQTVRNNPPEERIVFINAWNEWAEGCHLEPDLRYGHAWLRATHSAIQPGNDPSDLVGVLLDTKPHLDQEDLRRIVSVIDSQERAVLALQGELRKRDKKLNEQNRAIAEQEQSVAYQSFMRAKGLANKVFQAHPGLKDMLKRAIRRTYSS